MSEENEEKLRRVVADALGVDASLIGPDASPRTISSWTSFNHLTIIGAVEEAFGITMTMDEIMSVTSFASLGKAVAAQIGS